MKTAEELKGVVKEVFDDSLKASEKRMHEQNEAWQKAFEEKSKTEQDAILKRIEKIESTPAVKTRLAIPGTDKTTEVFLGYKVNRQLVDIYSGNRCPGAKDLIVNPKLFPVIADQEKAEGYAKHLLMVIKAATGDFKAKQAYEEWKEKAALGGSTATGSYLVPEEYANEIVAFARLQSLVLQKARIWPMGSDTLNVPSENAKVSTSWKTEGTAAGESEPTFNQHVLTAKKLTAYSIVSNELLADANVDVVSYLTECFAEAVGQELDDQMFTGTGDPVSGILTAAAGKSVQMSSGNTHFSAITGDNLLDMIDKIDQKAENGSEYYFHKNILTYIRKLKDSQNQYLFAPIAGGLPQDIWGYPYNKSPELPATGDSAAATAFVAFGNLRYAALGRRLEPMGLDLDPYGKFLEYQTRFRTVSRWGFAFYANAFCRLLTAAS